LKHQFIDSEASFFFKGEKNYPLYNTIAFHFGWEFEAKTKHVY